MSYFTLCLAPHFLFLEHFVKQKHTRRSYLLLRTLGFVCKSRVRGIFVMERVYYNKHERLLKCLTVWSGQSHGVTRRAIESRSSCCGWSCPATRRDATNWHSFQNRNACNRHACTKTDANCNGSIYRGQRYIDVQ